MDEGKTQLASLPGTMAVTANSFIATGGDGFTVFEDGQNPNTLLGSDLEAPDPNSGQKITKQG